VKGFYRTPKVLQSSIVMAMTMAERVIVEANSSNGWQLTLFSLLFGLDDGLASSLSDALLKVVCKMVQLSKQQP
jgi:hypothetical protein